MFAIATELNVISTHTIWDKEKFSSYLFVFEYERTFLKEEFRLKKSYFVEPILLLSITLLIFIKRIFCDILPWMLQFQKQEYQLYLLQWQTHQHVPLLTLFFQGLKVAHFSCLLPDYTNMPWLQTCHQCQCLPRWKI